MIKQTAYTPTGERMLFANDKKMLKEPLKLLRECKKLFEDIECMTIRSPREANLLKKINKYVKKAEGKSNGR